MRRSLLGLVPLLAMRGDGLRRPVNAPPSGVIYPGVQPGVNNSTVFARRVIIFGPDDGLFVYSGSPAFGNLIVAVVEQSVTDPYGNLVPFAGTNVFQPSSGLLLTLNGADLGWFTFATEAGPYSDAANLAYDVSLAAVLLSGALGASFDLEIPFYGPVYASEPGSPGTQETWHTFSSLSASWTGTLQYRLTTEGEVEMRSVGALGAGTLTNGTQIATMPTGYVPTNQGQVPVIISAVGAGSAAAAVTPYLVIQTSGAVEVENMATQVPTNVRVPNSTFALN